MRLCFLVTLTLVVISINSNCFSKDITPKQSDYPHWNFNDQTEYIKLVKLNNFIETNNNQGFAAVFDWDGTLYDENIPIKEEKGKQIEGQGLWYIWGASNLDKIKTPFFPMYRTKDQKFDKNIDNLLKFIGNKTNIEVNGYNAFAWSATTVAGMTPEDISVSMKPFMKEYPPENYLFYKMFDLVQNFINSGFEVWIITGSNPYFVAELINNIETNVKYTDKANYKLNICSSPYDYSAGHIIGNTPKLMPDGKFSIVFDNRYLKNKENKLYIVNTEGKKVVINNYLEQKKKKKVVFCGGNSGGDIEMMNYVLSQQDIDTMGVAVNPRGGLQDLKQTFPDKLIVLAENKK